MSNFDSIKTKNHLPFDFALDFDASALMSDEDKAEYRKKIANWGKKAEATLRAAIASQGISGQALKKSLKSKPHKTKDGDVRSVGFSFLREGIYVHKGAGKGMGGLKGSSWLDKYGTRKKTNPESLGKLATGNRKAKPWFDALDKDLPELGDIVAETYAARAIDATKLFNKQ